MWPELLGSSLTDAMLKAMWPCRLQMSSFKNQVGRGCAILVKLLRDKCPLCNHDSDASARARFVCKFLIYKHYCQSTAA
jgi:hypothetical protein